MNTFKTNLMNLILTYYNNIWKYLCVGNLSTLSKKKFNNNNNKTAVNKIKF